MNFLLVDIAKVQSTKFIAILNEIQMPKSCFENLEHTLCPSFRLFKESASVDVVHNMVRCADLVEKSVIYSALKQICLGKRINRLFYANAVHFTANTINMI